MKYIKFGHQKWEPKIDMYDKKQIDEILIKMTRSHAEDIKEAIHRRMKEMDNEFKKYGFGQ